MRVAVTGVGALCAVGGDASSFWRALLEGRSGVAPLTRFAARDLRSPMVAEAADGQPGAPNRVDRLALVAAREAISHARLGALPRDAGIALGAGVGGLPESEEAYFGFLGDGRLARRVQGFSRHIPATTADVLAAEFGARGPRISAATACTSSTAAIGEGALWIASGEVDCVLAGASDALTRLTVGGFNSLRLVSMERPRPFDRRRAGMVVGDAAAFLLLESEAHASARGAAVLAWLDGFGLSADAFHATAPNPEGDGALRAMRQALAMAGVEATAVDHVNAHGTGTVANDRAEARALVSLLGDRAPHVPVASIKGAVGHCLGAAGAIEAVASVMSLVHQTVPPCVGFGEADPEIPLRIPVQAESLALRAVLCANLAFGGNNAALLFSMAT